MIDSTKTDNPTKIAQLFAKEYSEKGYKLDFSLESLTNEIDKILENYSDLEGNERYTIEAELTAYIGESICEIFNGKWKGLYYGPLNPNGVNFYTCKIKVEEFEFAPSHFVEYYFSNGKLEEGSFKNYLINKDKSSGIFKGRVNE